jgi:hypothetical protein
VVYPATLLSRMAEDSASRTVFLKHPVQFPRPILPKFGGCSTVMKYSPKPLTFLPTIDVEFARSVHHQAYRDVVERQFGLWNLA